MRVSNKYKTDEQVRLERNRRAVRAEELYMARVARERVRKLLESLACKSMTVYKGDVSRSMDKTVPV